MFPIKKRVGHFGAYKSLVWLVTLTGVVPGGESHPEEEGGDEEKSERRENRRLLQRINLKKMSSTECFVTLPPHFLNQLEAVTNIQNPVTNVQAMQR